MSFSSLAASLSHPGLPLIALLTLGVILVNGWTDAPNAIATAVASKSLSFTTATALAAVCNLLGAFLSSAFFPAVTKSVLDLVRLDRDPQAAFQVLCAAMAAIIIWSAAACFWGIPTSESHGLLAGLTGAAMALEGGIAHINPLVWTKVLLALPLSVCLSFLLAKVLTYRQGKTKSPRFYRRAQLGGAAAMAFLHGAQDGQKFLGVFLLGLSLVAGHSGPYGPAPIWLMILCAGTMALGTALGGRRIIDNIGQNMVFLDLRRGLAADLAGAGTLLLCTLLGFPVSTTHTKTAAILGAGNHPNWSIARSIVLAWILTFPICGVLGFFISKVLSLFL